MEHSNKLGDAKKADQDVRLEQQILGTWICNAKLPWRIKGRVLIWKVESSNVPLVLKDEFSSITNIISVTDDKWTYVDPNDGQVKVDFRVR